MTINMPWPTMSTEQVFKVHKEFRETAEKSRSLK